MGTRLSMWKVGGKELSHWQSIGENNNIGRNLLEYSKSDNLDVKRRSERDRDREGGKGEGGSEARKKGGRERRKRESSKNCIILVTSDCYNQISLNGHFKLHVFNSHSSECREVQC